LLLQIWKQVTESSTWLIQLYFLNKIGVNLILKPQIFCGFNFVN
jgi:hypothetical protein